MERDEWAALPGRLAITGQNANLSMTIENVLNKMRLLPEPIKPIKPEKQAMKNQHHLFRL